LHWPSRPDSRQPRDHEGRQASPARLGEPIPHRHVPQSGRQERGRGHQSFYGRVLHPTSLAIDASTAVLLTTPDYEHSNSFSGPIATYVYPDGGLAGCSVSNSLAVITGF